MEYVKATAVVVEFETEEILTTSGTTDCGQTQWDAEYCDGVTQAVSKGQFGH